MSVMLSRIDFDPQELADKEEEELEREDVKQQQELKDFLDKELDDNDLFDATFTPHQSQGYENNNLPTYLKQNLISRETEYHSQDTAGNVYGQQTDHFSRGITHQNGHQESYHNHSLDDPYGEAFLPGQINSRQIHVDPLQRHYSEYNDQTTVPYKSRLSSIPQPYLQETNAENEPIGEYDSQLQVLYAARGRKIEELQTQIEELDDSTAKNKRILQHKLTMVTSERDGLKESNGQLQCLLQEHKKNIDMLQQQIEVEQNDNKQFMNQLEELNEKLNISDSTIDTLQQQIKQMNQSESISRARTHHESMLANLRQKHEEEILNLKEKLDDLQQALAWKVEDNNRYREMLDSNSMSSEVGLLRHRLMTEENKNKEQYDEIETQKKNIDDLEQQLKMFEAIVQKPTRFASTPFSEEVQMGLGKLDFKTPVSRFKATNNGTHETPPSGDSTIKNELVKALTMNREKRDEIKTLKNQLNGSKQKQHIEMDPSLDKEHSKKVLETCGECNKKQELIESKNDEILQLQNTFQSEVEKLKTDNAEIKTNMADLIKDFDKEKVRISVKQNDAMMKFVDDAKEDLRRQLSATYEDEKHALEDQIQQLNGDLLFTKEEYVKLGEEMKDIEEMLRDELKRQKDLELSELKTTLQKDYDNCLTKQQNEITNKYLEYLEKEKEKINLEWKEKLIEEVETAITLAKIDWHSEKKPNDAQQDLLISNQHNDKESLEQLNILLLEKEHSLTQAELRLKELEEQILEKESTWKVLKVTLQKRIDLLEKEVEKYNTKNQSQTNLLLENILNNTESEKCDCDKREQIWKLNEQNLKKRVEQLSLDLERTKEQLRHTIDINNKDKISIGNVRSPVVESRLSYVLSTKEKLWAIKESGFKKDLQSFKEDFEKLELRCGELDKTNVDLRAKVKIDQVERQNIKISHQADLAVKDEELDSVNKALSDARVSIVQLEQQINTLNGLEKKMLDEFEEKIYAEKKKWEVESSKLQEEALKAESERLKNNLLADIQTQNENGLLNDIKTLKEQHFIEIRELKQGFRQKLERISEMKKKWMKEEEQKRKDLQSSFGQQLTSRLSELQTKHDQFMKDQQDVWHKNMLKLQTEHSKSIDILQQELKTKEEYMNEQVKNFEQKVASITKEKENFQNNYESQLENTAENKKKSEKEILKSYSDQKQQDQINPYLKSSWSSKDIEDRIEKMREFYLKTLQQINNDVSTHIRVTRDRAAQEVKDAVRRERRRVLTQMKTKQSSRNNSKNNEQLTSQEIEIPQRKGVKKTHQDQDHVYSNDVKDNNRITRILDTGLTTTDRTSYQFDYPERPLPTPNQTKSGTKSHTSYPSPLDRRRNNLDEMGGSVTFQESRNHFPPPENISFDSSFMDFPVNLKNL